MAVNAPVRLELPGDKPVLIVEVLPRGLTIHRLIVHADGRENDIVIGPENAEDHVTQKYTNTIVGRYSNRIPVGKHVLERKGFKSEFEAKANENTKVSLHGGPTGYDAVVWTVLSKDEAPQLFSKSEVERIRSLPGSAYALFRLVSPDGDQGYPGELLTEVLIALVSPTPEQSQAGKVGHVVIVYRSKLTGQEKTVTPVNLTQHWGFNLDASFADGPQPEAASIKGHELTIEAEKIAKLGELALPTADYTPASSVPAYDFHQQKSKAIGKEFPASGYDDYFRLVDSVVYPAPRRILLADLEFFNPLDAILTQGSIGAPSSVQLASKKSGIALKFFSNQRGVMFYSNNLTTPTKGARKLIHGGSGISGHGNSYGPGTAAFLEFHDPLAAFLQPENKDAEDTLITSDELYNNFVRLEISLTKA
ncbi:galactose mutarotase-like protein [Macrolepiota fuliginosa MF-IS2]|uniref:Galactose mutarotase-like protein n=1 Tax=Macrolepiota fuliginosa MF-IS2 TaxID=1400762 RepID=A0A9P5X5Z1_9AGAR|nr:galactose mutarotase-like protein [Macrolepiota fuliginosa MF-IS2]